MLLESFVPSKFRIKALTTNVYLINRLLSPSLQNQSSCFRLFAQHPSFGHLHTFGCVCFMHLPPQERNKLSAQSIKCAFLGYAPHQNDFLYYNPNARRVSVSHNIIFLENQYSFKPSKISFLPLIS